MAWTGGLMVGENSKGAGFKRRAQHELKQFVGIFLYLAFFFCAIATYRMILLNEFLDLYFYYSAAMLNALVIAKVILAGEYVHLGKKYEGKPLFLSALYKAFLFSLLVFGFHHVEEVIKRLLHGQGAAGAFHDVRTDELLGRGIIIFCTFISFFAFRELRRVLGEDKFYDLFFRGEVISSSDLARRQAVE